MVRIALALVVATGIAYAQSAPDAPAPAPNAPAPSPPTEPPDALVQPAPSPVPSDPAIALRDANAAAVAGDWARVDVLVEPLLRRQLAVADLAEAHRLAGLANYFAQRLREAEAQFVAYLKIDLDAHLDPALYPPEVVAFFDDVRAQHAAELRALRPRPKRYLLLNLVPPFGQFQNGDRVKGWVVAGMFGGFAIANVTGYLVLRHFCLHVSGPGGSSLECEQAANHDRAASAARTAEIVGAIGLVVTYIYGVYDGVTTYRQLDREQLFAPYATPTNNGAVLGVAGVF